VILDNDVMGEPQARGAAQPDCLVRVYLRTAGDTGLGGDGSLEWDAGGPIGGG